MNRRLMVVLGVVAVLFIVILAKGLSVVLLGDGDVGAPSTSKLLPLPDGTAVVVDKAFPGEGSLGAGRRFLVLDTSKGSRPVLQVTGSYLDPAQPRVDVDRPDRGTLTGLQDLSHRSAHDRLPR